MTTTTMIVTMRRMEKCVSTKDSTIGGLSQTEGDVLFSPDAARPIRRVASDLYFPFSRAAAFSICEQLLQELFTLM